VKLKYQEAYPKIMKNTSGTFAFIRNLTGAAGIFIGFFFGFSGEPGFAVEVVAVMAVGIVGFIAFVSHVIFSRSDAERLGWGTDHPYWQYEVGFANLSLAVVTFVTWIAGWGIRVLAVLILCFAVYLLQSGFLHGWQSLKEQDGKRLGRAIQTIFFSIVMIGFGFMGIVSG
jgi:hypothetical protein